MHNVRLFYLICVGKLAPDHFKSLHRADALDSKLYYSKFLPVVVVLSSRQSPLHNQDLNVSLTLKANWVNQFLKKR